MSEARSTRWMRLAMVLALAGGVVATPTLAQTIRGTMTGTVTDSTGAVVPGITVTVTHTATGISSSAVTDRQGGYTIPLLPSGTYQATVEQSGFKKYLHGGIVIQIEEGVSGFLVTSVEEAAKRTLELLKDPALRRRMADAGRERVRDRFLITRDLRDQLDLVSSLAAPTARPS